MKFSVVCLRQYIHCQVTKLDNNLSFLVSALNTRAEREPLWSELLQFGSSIKYK